MYKKVFPQSLALFFIMLCLVFSMASAEEPNKIRDNSFLIEEAYNQEYGVIQHIQTFQYMKDRTWAHAFTQEWPVPGMTHQLSYTVPTVHVTDPHDTTGIGDVMINYRYQAIMQDRYAFAPRFSLLLPTGDYKRGLGSDSLGMQTNLPFSLELSDKWVTHWNVGTTYIPNGKDSDGAESDNLVGHAGASINWLVKENFNLMLEVLWTHSEIFHTEARGREEESLFISPGARYAINFDSGLQVVPGIAFPVGVGASEGEYGVFAYLSFEHPLF
jgi:hypothetical protein